MISVEFLRIAIAAPGQCIVKHMNGNIYYLDSVGQMQVDGEWVESVMYHCIQPFGNFCRAIDDFSNFTYLHNLTMVGPRG